MLSKPRLSSIIDVRPGEVAITVLMSLYYFLVMVTYYFLKPARDSLFLVELGAEQLPFVFILIAVIVAPLTGLYARASRRFRLSRLINITTLLLVGCIVVLRLLLNLQHGWVFYVFYIWVSIYGILTVSQFWLMANAVYDATQAKRIFVLLGSSAIIGSFVGGEVTAFLVSEGGIATPDLLYFCGGFLLVCTCLSFLIWRRLDERRARPRRRSTVRPHAAGFRDSLRTVARHRHLRLIVGIIAAAMMAGTLVDYQFKTISVATFTQERELASFLGQFYGRLSLVSLLLQLLLVQRLLRWVGVGGVILFMPVGLLLGSVGLFVFPGIIAAVLLRGTDAAFEYSLDKTGRELLYLPVPLDVKERTKVFIDMFVDRWFRGLAGVLLLLLTVVLDFSVPQIALVVIGVIALWIVFCLKIRIEYVNAFRTALQRREIDLSEIRHAIGESSTIKSLLASLQSRNEREVVYALTMLESVNDAGVLAHLPPLLEHDSPEVRRRVLSLLHVDRDPAVTGEAERLLADADPEVRIEAMRYLLNDAGRRSQLIASYLAADNPQLAATAIACVGRHGSDSEREAVTPALAQRVADQLDDRDPTLVIFLRSLGSFSHPEFAAYLERMLDSDSARAVRATIAGIAELKDLLLLPRLIELLRDRRFRPDAGRAIAAYGPTVLLRLADDLQRPDLAMEIRRHIPRTMVGLPIQATVDSLVEALSTVEPELTFYVMKALNKLRARHPELRFPAESVDAALVEQTRMYYAIANVLAVKGGAVSAADSLLQRALEEKQTANLERIFRLLGLRYPPDDIYSAWQGIVSSERAMRANAIEFLDNLIHSGIKRYLLPILDNLPSATLIRKGEELFGQRFDGREEALAYLLDGNDPWLKSCAIYASSSSLSPRLRRRIEAAADDAHPTVRETARAVIS